MMKKGFGRSVGKGFRKANGVKLMDVTKAKPDDVVGTRPWSQRSSGSSSSSGASSGSSSRPSTGSSMNSTSLSTRSLGILPDQDVVCYGELEEEDVFAFSVFDTDPIEPDDTASIVSAEVDQNITDRTSTTSYHPSDEVNKRLLEMFPHSNVAITHDSQWASVLDGAEHDFPPDEILFEKITKHFVVMVNNGKISHAYDQ
ncbi:hypothetical protein D9758_010920 [Tetrapyrgos nigripes]|uniref:Uncharacterized protein n=1 Tax=Tetrapyrgos nigripes TaxID=182062 RepID=A0A8H5CWI5_9AGAR|nr:hypothetical protein D9758_010920 [Tetrapyrgos nigripes]